MSGQIHIAPAEEIEIFQKHCAEVVESLSPDGPIERRLAQAIAEDMWRLQRARALENGIFAQGFRDHADSMNAGHPEVDAALAQSRTWSENAHSLHLLTVYEQRIRRAVEKNTAELKALQAERKAAHKTAVDQATLFTELAESKGEIYRPAADFVPASAWGGFVFSSDDLALVRDRQRRLSEAWSCHLAARHPEIPRRAA